MNIRCLIFGVVVICLFGLPAFGQPWDGNGVEGDPYLIWDACDMQAIGADANYWDAHFRLMADIDLGDYTEATFNIIGTWDDPFTGIFDGNGHTISNYTYDSNLSIFGLFYVVDDPSAEIKDLSLINIDIYAYRGPIINVLVSGTITGCSIAGGTVESGGLVGGNAGTISNCFANVSVTGEFETGGLVGHNTGTVFNCHANGDVTGYGRYVGGLVGRNRGGTIINSSATGSITGTDRYIGGLIGVNSEGGEISGCYASGDVNGVSVDDMGGLLGYNSSDSNVLNCYATGNISGDDRVGGLIGRNEGMVANCYAAGIISGDTSVGGLVGHDDNGSYAQSFWDKTINPTLTGIGNANDPEVIGESTANMHLANTFIQWSCDPVWTIDDGNDYPHLWWENKPGELLTVGRWYAGGSGDVNAPYLVENLEQLKCIARIPCDFNSHFKLMADIDMSGYSWSESDIIGKKSAPNICIPWIDPDSKPFTGFFDGNGHIISNFTFTYDSNSTGLVGLFGYTRDAIIKNLGFIDPNIIAETSDYCEYVGTLVGMAYGGGITDCYVEGGKVESGTGAGGLIGLNVSDVCDCYSTASVTGQFCIGGVIGQQGSSDGWGGTISGWIHNSYSEGSISGRGGIGGLVGCNSSGSINKCQSASHVSGERRVGGLGGSVWNEYPEISDSYATGTVSGANDVGGLFGAASAELYNCYATGDVLGDVNTGGLIGYYSYGTMSNCYSTGSVDGNDRVGGLLGWNGESATIVKCYSVGRVLGNSEVGGLVGHHRGIAGGRTKYTKCFWDVNINPDVNGIGNKTDPNVIGETTANMQTESTFTDAGWDFVGEVVNGPNDFWDICEVTNYPKLVWQIPVGDFVCPDGVTLIDFSVLGAAWMCEPNDYCWDPNCDISEPNDNIIDEWDLEVFTGNWLEGL